VLVTHGDIDDFGILGQQTDVKPERMADIFPLNSMSAIRAFAYT
jgi:hypothetical protein